MGLLNGTMSMRLYRIEGDLPKKYREEFLEEIGKNAFRELGAEKEFGSGWVTPENFLDTSFSDQNVFRNQYLTLSLRVDKKQVNARLFRALLAQELEKFKKQSNKEKVKPSEKREIKERLQRKLLAETEPRRATFDVCWDTGTSKLYFFNTGDRTQDLFREAYWKTFHLEPVQQTIKARFEAVAGEALPPDMDDAGREFLGWLYWRTDQTGGKFELEKSGEVHLWIEDRMLYKDEGERPASTALSGGDPARWPESRASLAGGKKLSRVKLGMKRGEREWSFTLDGETLDVTTLKIPALLTDAEDEALFERLALLEEATFVIDELFGEWAKTRLADEWERGDLVKMTRWIQEGAPAGAGGAGGRQPPAERPEAASAIEGSKKVASGGAARRSRIVKAIAKKRAR